MKLLALDTSSVACSVAVQVGGDVTERHEEKPREHTRILLPMIRAALDEAGTSTAELSAIVLGNGPGSFIGMRIAVSVAQGLAYGSSIGIVPVSSMAAVAAQVFAEHDATEVVVAQDAHMHEAYLGIYRPDAAGLPVAVNGERLCRQELIPELEANEVGRRFGAGLGWQRYPDLLAANRIHIDVLTEIFYPRARYLLGLAETMLKADSALDPRDIEPAYLRQQVAKKPASLT